MEVVVDIEDTLAVDRLVLVHKMWWEMVHTLEVVVWPALWLVMELE